MDNYLPPRFAIKIGHAQEAVPCAICDQLTTVMDGPDLFLADTWEPVCWDCGLKLAPEFMHMLGVYWMRRAATWGWVVKSA